MTTNGGRLQWAWLGLFALGFCALCISVLIGQESIGILVTIAAFVIAAFFTLAPTSVDKGADGLLVRWLWVKRFIGYDEIEDSEIVEMGWRGPDESLHLVLRLVSNDEYHIVVGTRAGAFRLRGLHARIKQAQGRYLRGQVPLTESLRRRDQNMSFVEWVVALRSGLEVNVHRRGALDAEQLWRVAEEPSAEPWSRAAAAVALGSLRDDERERLLRVAAATAEPKLRVALERVGADADVDVIAESLCALEEDSNVPPPPLAS